MSDSATKPEANPAGEPVETGEADDVAIGRALRWSLALFVVIGLIGGGVAWWLNRPREVVSAPPPTVEPPKIRPPSVVAIPATPFTDITKEAGITFVHENGAAGERLLPETMGSGCAFFDYDNDGDPDLLFVNGKRWEWDKRPQQKPATMALYRNDGKGKFTDVTVELGLDKSFYGTGVATGDFDNDGWVDLYITSVGPNHLFRNDQGKKFTDVTESAGVAGSRGEYSSSAVFFDLDNDGDLDLFVANYVRWNRDIDLAQNFTLNGTDRAYGPPRPFEGTFPYLYRNDGQGKFTDISEPGGVQVKSTTNTGVPMAKSLGVVAIDIDDDGWQDIIVANDTVQNFLFHNQKNGKFSEIGLKTGIAMDERGDARGAMGIDAARFLNNKTIGVAIGNFANEPTALYCTHEGAGGPDSPPVQFTDDAMATGFGPQTRESLKFGVLFCDVDLDGRLDILQANGHLEQEINKIQVNQHYKQAPQLFWNAGKQKSNQFPLMPAEKCGKDFVNPLVARGSACADIDGDGDLDYVMTTTGGPPRLLRNDQQLGNHWLRLKLKGTTSNRDAIGAQIDVAVKGEHFLRQVMPGRSYLSHSELPVTVGIGKADKVEKVTIRWPDGTSQEVTDPKINGLTTITQTAKK